MMTANAYLEDAARELLGLEISAAQKATDCAPRADWHETNSDWQSGLFWLLPELVEMLVEGRDQPVELLTPVIRCRILEQNFTDESGDSVLDSQLNAQVEDRVLQLLHVLQQVRQLAQTHGLWSAAPVTPLMCG